ncbi:MAG: hypothetical protein AAGG75_15255 [Bacteroidota bacterium]
MQPPYPPYTENWEVPSSMSGHPLLMEEKVYESFLQLQDFINWAIQEKVLDDQSATFLSGYSCGQEFSDPAQLLQSLGSKFDAALHFAPAYENVLQHRKVLAGHQLDELEKELKRVEQDCDEASPDSKLSNLKAEQRRLKDQHETALDGTTHKYERKLAALEEQRAGTLQIARQQYNMELQRLQEEWSRIKAQLQEEEALDKKRQELGKDDFFAQTLRAANQEHLEARRNKISDLKEQLELLKEKIQISIRNHPELEYQQYMERSTAADPDQADTDDQPEVKPSEAPTTSSLLDSMNRLYTSIFEEYKSLSTNIKEEALVVPILPDILFQVVSSFVILFGEFYLIQTCTNEVFEIDSGNGLISSFWFTIALPTAIGMYFKLRIMLSEVPRQTALRLLQSSFALLLLGCISIASLNAFDISDLFSSDVAGTDNGFGDPFSVASIKYPLLMLALLFITLLFSGMAGILMGLGLRNLKKYHRLTKGGAWHFFHRNRKKKTQSLFSPAYNRSTIEYKNELENVVNRYHEKIKRIEQEHDEEAERLNETHDTERKKIDQQYNHRISQQEKLIRNLLEALKDLCQQRARLRALADEALGYDKVDYKQLILDLKEALIANVLIGFEKGRMQRMNQMDEEDMVDLLVKKKLYQRFPDGSSS